MRRDALRTLLVVSERPHPWAFLRDRLDPDLVTVAWARPAETAAVAAPAPWMLAGTGPLPPEAVSALRGRLFGCRWVGAPAPDLSTRPLLREDWQAVAADAERALAGRLAGVRLAPGSGLVLPDGSYLPGAGTLEVLLSAHPEGLAIDPPGPRLRSALRRVAALLERHRLPLRVAWRDGRLALSTVEAGDDGRAS